MNDPLNRRFPTTNRRYRRLTGELLPIIIGKILDEIGFKTEINNVASNGVDLKVFNKRDEIVMVGKFSTGA